MPSDYLPTEVVRPHLFTRHNGEQEDAERQSNPRINGIGSIAIHATLGARIKEARPITTTVVETWIRSLAPTSRNSSWLISSPDRYQPASAALFKIGKL